MPWTCNRCGNTREDKPLRCEICNHPMFTKTPPWRYAEQGDTTTTLKVQIRDPSPLALFTRLIREHFAVLDFTDASTPDDLFGWDSIAHMILCDDLCEHFQIMIDIGEIAQMDTIGEIKQVLRSKGVQL